MKSGFLSKKKKGNRQCALKKKKKKKSISYGLSRSRLIFLFVCFCVFRRNQELIKELSVPPPGSSELYFPTQYSQPFLTQLKACFWKMHWSYWRNSQFNAVRFFMTIVIAIMFGIIFWDKGTKMWVYFLFQKTKNKSYYKLNSLSLLWCSY